MKNVDEKDNCSESLGKDEGLSRLEKLDREVMLACHLEGQEFGGKIAAKDRKEVFELNYNKAWCLSYSRKQTDALRTVVCVSKGIQDLVRIVRGGALNAAPHNADLLQDMLAVMLGLAKELNQAVEGINDVLQEYISENEGFKVTPPSGIARHCVKQEQGAADGIGCVKGGQ